MADDSDPDLRPRDLEKENRTLARKLKRMDSNFRQMEVMQDATSTLLSKLTRELEEERAKSEALLLNILPKRIIDRLEGGEQTIADRFPRAHRALQRHRRVHGDLVGHAA